jgi:hypothetical protein
MNQVRVIKFIVRTTVIHVESAYLHNGTIFINRCETEIPKDEIIYQHMIEE